MNFTKRVLVLTFTLLLIPCSFAAASLQALLDEFEQCPKPETSYEIAKQYFSEDNNILGIEYLSKTVELAQDKRMLSQIEDMILNKIYPKDIYDSNNLYEILGQVYLKLDDKENAYNAFNKALKLNPDDIALRYYLGNIFLLNKQNNGALAIYNTILYQNPKEAQIRALKAQILLEEGNLLSAHREFLEILKIYPNSNRAKYGIYKIYEGKIPIEQIFCKIHETDPRYTPDGYEIKSLMEFAKSLKDENVADALELYLEKVSPNLAKKTPPKPQEAPKTKAASQQKNENMQKLLKFDEAPKQAVKKQPEKKQVQPSEIKEKIELKKQIEKKPLPKKEVKEEIKKEEIKKEEIKAEKKDKEEIKKPEEQNKNAKEDKNEEALYNREQKAALESEHYKKHKTQLETYLKTEPKTKETYVAIANTYKLALMPYSALRYYRKAKALDPTNSDIYFNIGLTYMELNKLDLAKENLERSLGLNKDNQKAKNILAFINQKAVTQIINSAYSNYENKKYIEAFETLDKGIKEYPQNAQLHYYRALVFVAMQRNAAAIIDLQYAIDLDPGYYLAYYQLGKIYEKVGDYKSALVSYERFLSTEPEEKEMVSEIEKKVIELGKRYY